MKTDKGRFLSVILGALFALSIALGVCFAIPKISKTAYAGTELYDGSNFNEAALADLAADAQYSNYYAMIEDVKNGKSLNITSFNNHVVTFGGKEWWVVYATKIDDGCIVLTLWLKDSLGIYTWTDGTRSLGASIPRNNNYSTSWIHAAINAGNTTLGYYYGTWDNNNGSSCTKYNNDIKSPSAAKAPNEFKDLADFAAGGKYSDVILPASTVSFGSNRNGLSSYTETGYSGEWGLDNVFLPSILEAQANGVWGATSAQWPDSGSYVWLRNANLNSYRNAFVVDSDGGVLLGNLDTKMSYEVRPAINLRLTPPLESEPTDVEKVYTGSALSLKDIVDTWYNEENMKVELPNEDMINVGTYQVKVTITDGITIFNGEPDESLGEDDVTRYFTVTITKATPKVTEGSKADSYNADSMPDLSAILSAKNPVSGIAVAGTYTYDGDPSPTAGTDSYAWTFTPTDTDNYEIVTGSISLTFEESDNDTPVGGGTTGDGDDNNSDDNDNTDGSDDDTDNNDSDSDSGDNDDSGSGSGSGSGTTDPNNPDNPGDGSDGSDGSGSGTGSGSGDGSDSSSDGSGSGDGTDGSDSSDGSGTDSSDGSDSDSDNDSENDSDSDNDSNSDSKNDDNENKGVAAVWNWLKNNWWWLLIALAALLLFIIIIVAIAKRRKKEEEPVKKVVETVAKEVTPQPQMVATASVVPAQPVVQPVQPVQAVQPVVQPVVQPAYDFSILAEIRADVAELKARQNMAPQMNFMPVPAPQSNYAPVSAPAAPQGGQADYHAMFAEERARAAEAKLSEERVRAEAKIAEERVRTEERARAAEQRAALAEERFLHGGAQGAPTQSAVVPTVVQSGIPAEVVVALLEAVRGNVPTPTQFKPAAQVPPDAVVTTTTTVDRTKNKPVALVRNENTNFDVDGFYDKFE